ncbi:hypothetical protein OCU04_011416 [Sclerotinia nivalis]|uniref:Uncharacterized protein n=1 Tax=Sclerotinia nivalis TaxID=352851 RepID=A0A9X0AC93_9HELO|nr:hypothetical protein OCU04_011416 [Sclerotinia nivalis]
MGDFLHIIIGLVIVSTEISKYIFFLTSIESTLDTSVLDMKVSATTIFSVRRQKIDLFVIDANFQLNHGGYISLVASIDFDDCIVTDDTNQLSLLLEAGPSF